MWSLPLLRSADNQLAGFVEYAKNIVEKPDRNPIYIGRYDCLGASSN
jgi:hypothetical protein